MDQHVNPITSDSKVNEYAMSDIIPYKDVKFVIMHCPFDKDSEWTIKKLKEYQIKHVFRLCNQDAYSIEPYSLNGIQIHDEIKFQDGGIPNKTQVQQWFDLVDKYNNEVIAVHCVSGIGRAPVLVALAFIHKGMDPLETIEYVRKFRRRALNNVQINFLSEFKSDSACCSIQ